MELYPAIDIRGGRCVRLVEGDFERETVYGDDPVAVALTFVEAGARWIHVVDLDAARTGDPVNRGVVAAVVDAVSGEGVSVQSGGGVRSIEAAEALLDGARVSRVVVGTAAVEEPALLTAIAERWPGRVAAGLDHRGGEVRLRGWLEGGGRRVEDLVPEMVAGGAIAIVVTDISRDGRLEGPDVEGLRSLLEATGAPLIASGGVRGIDDLRALAGAGLGGAIVGKAIYEGVVDLAEALKAVSA